MVEDELHIGALRNQSCSGVKLARPNQHVVAVAQLAEPVDSRDDIVSREKIIRLALRNVPKPFKMLIATPARHARFEVRRAEIDPPDNAAHHRKLRGEVEQEIGLGFGLIRLHRH